MPITARKGTTGGRGNEGKFIERDPSICAAGISSTAGRPISECFQHYSLQDQVDALKQDSIPPPQKPKPLPPLRKPRAPDMRFAGFYTQVAEVVNPPEKSKFEQLVVEIKETPYASYWKKNVGKAPDTVPMLPKGMDPIQTTFGRKVTYNEPLYNIIFPTNPVPDMTPKGKEAGAQTTRNYCSPPFTNLKTYGCVHRVPENGVFAKCVLDDDTKNIVYLSTTQANYLERTHAKIGKVLAPNDNISEFPPGHSFGVLTKHDSIIECMSHTKLNPNHNQLKKCLAHLNSVRINISKRYLPHFFNDFYLKLRYLDKERTGCLSNAIVYEAAMKEMLRFESSLLEPLLKMWNAFDGNNIKYRTLVDVLNYRLPLPDLSKVPDIETDCNDFLTTYTDMVKPRQEVDCRPRAGIPSARYFDMDLPKTPNRYCSADLINLPDELTMRACVFPSIMTSYFVNHRDMYCKREPEALRAIFGKAGKTFSDEIFDELWNKAKEYHPNGYVSIESFRKTMEGNPEPKNKNKPPEE